MRIDHPGVELVRNFEGCRLHAYRCPAGILTIGYGCTEGVTEDMTITEVEAEAMLARHLEPLQVHIEDMIAAELSQPQWDAVVCLVFNIGVAAFKKSALLKCLNSGDMSGAADEFLKWNKIKGEVSPGLAKRRAAERELFLRG